ncbi:MAG: hypothetical protein ABL311_11005 [Nitratireductor rhodophyticola]
MFSAMLALTLAGSLLATAGAYAADFTVTSADAGTDGTLAQA